MDQINEPARQVVKIRDNQMNNQRTKIDNIVYKIYCVSDKKRGKVKFSQVPSKAF